MDGWETSPIPLLLSCLILMLFLSSLLCMPKFPLIFLARLLPVAAFAFLCSCGVVGQQQQQQVKAPDRIPAYQFSKGSTALLLENGKAVPPPGAPPQVKRAIAAANSIVGKPYRRGGGHRKHHDSCYDCSGSVSFVLKEAGLLSSTRHSPLFLKYGQSGPGKWISVYVKNGHVFMVVCGLRFDTTGSNRGSGPAWRVSGRPAKGFVVRHPRGF